MIDVEPSSSEPHAGFAKVERAPQVARSPLQPAYPAVSTRCRVKLGLFMTYHLPHPPAKSTKNVTPFHRDVSGSLAPAALFIIILRVCTIDEISMTMPKLLTNPLNIVQVSRSPGCGRFLFLAMILQYSYYLHVVMTGRHLARVQCA